MTDLKKPFLLFSYVIMLLVSGCVQNKQTVYSDYPINAISIKNVELTDSFWLPKIKVIQEVTIPYSFDKCQKEGRMDNFLIAGGKLPGPVRGKMPFDDTDLYKIIEGAAYSLVSNPNPALDAYLDSIISIISIGQEPDGYITTWFTIDRQNPPASWANASENRWDFEITNHELYNSGHLFEAAAAHYWATGEKSLLDIALKNADLLVASFGPGKVEVPPGHQIVETGLIRLYHITQNPSYLNLAKYYLDLRGDTASHKLYGAYNQDHLPVVKQDEVVGHAVRAVYQYAGMTDIAAIYNDKAYLNAVNKLWENMVTKKMYITGGIGARHEGEAFGENYELPNKTAYCETCAAIGSVQWNHRLFLLTGNKKYYDIIERTLYNGLISGISQDGTKFFYPNPLESDGEMPFNMGSCTRAEWFDCSCCPTNLIRFVPSVPGLIYAVRSDSLYINLYMSNKAQFEVNQKPISIAQQTGYPWNGNVSVMVNPQDETAFTIMLRIPGWAQNQAVPGDLYSYTDVLNDEVTLLVNGQKEVPVVVNGYIQLSKKWKKGDKIDLQIPMSVRRVVTNTKVQENLNKVAFEYGPVVYCAEEADNPAGLSGLSIADNVLFVPSSCTVLNESVKVIEEKVVSNKVETKLTLIPYYLWSNRGCGNMKVWFTRE